MAERMGKTKNARRPAPCFRQIDMRDWLVWMDAALELGQAVGHEHRRLHTITTELQSAVGTDRV